MKNFFTLLLLATFTLLVSCNDDDNKKANSLIGEWKYLGWQDHNTDTFIPADRCLESTMKYNQNGTGLSTTVSLCQTTIPMPAKFTWKKEDGDNNYSITLGDETSFFSVAFENSNKILISFGNDNSTVFERK